MGEAVAKLIGEGWGWVRSRPALVCALLRHPGRVADAETRKREAQADHAANSALREGAGAVQEHLKAVDQWLSLYERADETTRPLVLSLAGRLAPPVARALAEVPRDDKKAS